MGNHVTPTPRQNRGESRGGIVTQQLYEDMEAVNLGPYSSQNQVSQRGRMCDAGRRVTEREDVLLYPFSDMTDLAKNQAFGYFERRINALMKLMSCHLCRFQSRGNDQRFNHPNKRHSIASHYDNTVIPNPALGKMLQIYAT